MCIQVRKWVIYMFSGIYGIYWSTLTSPWNIELLSLISLIIYPVEFFERPT